VIQIIIHAPSGSSLSLPLHLVPVKLSIRAKLLSSSQWITSTTCF